MFSYTKLTGQTVVGVGIDFAAWLEEGEILNAVTITGDNSVFTNSWVDETKALATLTGGVAGERYVLRYSIIGSLGTERYEELELSVVDAIPTCTVVLDMKSLGLAPVENVKLVVRSRHPKSVNGAVISKAPVEILTGSDGHAEIPVPQGIGIEIDVAQLGIRLTASTTSESTLHVSDLLM